jgi:hypothetical protein
LANTTRTTPQATVSIRSTPQHILSTNTVPITSTLKIIHMAKITHMVTKAIHPMGIISTRRTMLTAIADKTTMLKPILRPMAMPKRITGAPTTILIHTEGLATTTTQPKMHMHMTRITLMLTITSAITQKITTGLIMTATRMPKTTPTTSQSSTNTTRVRLRNPQQWV